MARQLILIFDADRELVYCTVADVLRSEEQERIEELCDQLGLDAEIYEPTHATVEVLQKELESEIGEGEDEEKGEDEGEDEDA